MDKTRIGKRRTLISLIVVLAIFQVVILAYLWNLLHPAAPPEADEPTPYQVQLPAERTVVPASSTPLPASEEIEVGPLISATSYAAPARAFDEERALEHLAYLASDELGGRQPGTPGARAAGDYIAARFAEYGLEPAGVDSTYFQTFTVPYGRLTGLPTLAVISPAGEPLTHTYDYRSDYRALTGGYLGAGEGEGPVVWLNRCLHEDYAGLDAEGQVVLCRYTGDPEVYRQAIEHQVGGLLLLDREREGDTFRRGGYRDTAWVPQTIPAYLISEAVAQDLLVGTDYTLDALSLRFNATPLSTTVRMAVTLEEQEAVEARNVLALLPGSDPEGSDEIVVIGAHYDHLGREPDGAIINGANDNASGVAAMLEIARLWQAQDFQPARSVLFAAWDGEEQGLLGSRHYVEHPTLPLTRTVAMLNLDMVGAGEGLQIDGEGEAAMQLRASAQTYGVANTVTFRGRSDHFSFYQARIPAAMLIWWPDAYYHTPDDEVEVIEPENLRTVGVLSAHTLAALAKGHVELERAVERLEASIAAGDREAFLAGLDPADADLQAAQSGWFDNLHSRGLAEMSIEPSQMRVGDGEADVTLHLSYHWADATRRHSPVYYDVRFVERGGVWAFAGYELEALAGDALTVARFPDMPVDVGQLLTTTEQAYLNITAGLGMKPLTSTRVVYYPDEDSLRTIARPATERDTAWLAQSAGLAEIAWSAPITPALVNLALNQMGLPPDEGVWLREGLALHYEDDAGRDYLPTIVATELSVPLLDFPILDGLPERDAQALRGYAWGATEYLLEQHGAAGLRALCAAWGRSGPDAAFREALGASPTQFESAWRADWLVSLRADAEGIQSTIAARAGAVLERDEMGFLATVTLNDPVLRVEESGWFADLSDHPVVTYTLAGELVAWSPRRREATVELRANSVLTGGQSSSTSYDALFVREDGRWRYAGVSWDEQASEHFVLKYQDRGEAWARRVLDLAETVYDRVTSDLEATPPLPQEIKLYQDGELFRTSVSLSLSDWENGWTGPGAAIKLRLLEDEGEGFIQRAAARELTHQLLFAQGLEIDWLHEGVANFEIARVFPLGAHWVAGQYSSIVQEAIDRHNEFPIYSFPSWENVSDEQAALFQAQAWSLVSFIVERHGLPGLRRFVAQSTDFEDTATNLRTALGVEVESFRDEWREYARIAGAPGDLVSLANRFDPDRALGHIETLASPQFAGRQAGAPGADLAADYVAGQFAALGLQPLGDPLTPTAAMTETVALGYLQRFPISYTRLISVPALTLLDGDGSVLYSFTYRDEFVESSAVDSERGAGAGVARGELVWVHAEDLGGMQFGRAVVIEQDVPDPISRAAQLRDHGAGGLIVVTDKESKYLQAGHVRPSQGAGTAIPVFEITRAAFENLLTRLGIERQDLLFAPPALPLGVEVRHSLVYFPITTTLTANVVGLWPGVDPNLKEEVLIVAAHYDHIGRSPDGLYFPGANRNASGVAALLEMARVWRENGYRPARSVLFVAWGGEELGSAGVDYYLDRPLVPLTRTVGVIALDSLAGPRGYKLLIYGIQDRDQPLVQSMELSADQLDRRAWRRSNAVEGWYTLFESVGLPTVKLIWAEAEEDFYLPTDSADSIDLEHLASSGEILTLAISWLASR